MTSRILTAAAAVLTGCLQIGQAPAETLVAARTIRAHEIVTASDFSVTPAHTPGAIEDISDAAGLEARITIFAGRPVMHGHLGPAAVIERNEIVSIVFRRGSLTITSEGRALERGGIGDRVRLLSLKSRSNVAGTVMPDATVLMDGSDSLRR